MNTTFILRPTGIKEVKIAGRETYFIDEYIRCGKGYVGAVQKYTLYNNVPRLLIETVCIVGVVLYLLYLYLSGQESEQVISILSAFALAIARDRKSVV